VRTDKQQYRLHSSCSPRPIRHFPWLHGHREPEHQPHLRQIRHCISEREGSDGDDRGPLRRLRPRRQPRLQPVRIRQDRGRVRRTRPRHDLAVQLSRNERSLHCISGLPRLHLRVNLMASSSFFFRSGKAKHPLLCASGAVILFSFYFFFLCGSFPLPSIARPARSTLLCKRRRPGMMFFIPPLPVFCFLIERVGSYIRLEALLCSIDLSHRSWGCVLQTHLSRCPAIVSCNCTTCCCVPRYVMLSNNSCESLKCYYGQLRSSPPLGGETSSFIAVIEFFFLYLVISSHSSKIIVMGTEPVVVDFGSEK